MTATPAELSRHYAQVARAIDYLQAHREAQPSLDALADSLHMSPFHLQRLFAEWAGISPKRFLQYLTKEYALAQLAEARDVLSVTHAAGLSSPSRLFELMVSCEAMTPGEIKAGGLGLQLGCGFGDSPFGPAFLAWTTRGLCHFAFCAGLPAAMLTELSERWPHASLRRDDEAAAAWLARIFPRTPTRGTLHLVLKGTNFQIKVWEALLAIAPGEVITYSDLAARAGAPKAQRAVGSALAANAIGYLIPCHRVIRASGDVGQYRWGSERKRALLAWEAAHAGAQEIAV
ncbi:MAG: bifunctional helix-turn-helix domain-containing protein/methylated-DNA--[protein]-cysteine S-methyltransferase [Paludibacterium sp.]|uniref:bifunctional helix-turn-helix domain-containing protein/methylated-DNA--[protein]-cysteine S-methyltransferase n=1 Tax=Paludibacterium sp. TaxID=1917523 RepID=UPI002600F2A1|nr:bifunctional helix-turn-helix domain-containing protein/methylated-DNA--[protein]-cysteine S-methyltransferase [Paludibacterium sp.]MBV8048202.1 bifunctional helix-turn-helix domain-containing protein/methylated-DNA--[protein]-cysteine S-methyltransferase [Paludibacterium sp.]